jgi:NAD(P)-dependent dehydrogenase (short-subunit alcohol dehydrogenase family)
MPDLSHKVALVTGAAHRVGRSIALALAAAGAHVVVHHYQSTAAAQDTLNAIRQFGVRALPVQADQSDPAAVRAVFETVDAAFGRLDILVNSASMFQRSDFLTLEAADWQRTLDVNLTGPFLMSQHAARIMQRQTPPEGVIVNILDNIGLQPWPDYTAHSVAKSGLHMHTRLLARRLAPDIRVNGIVPGPVLKPEVLPDARWQAIGAQNPLERTGTPEDVARAVTFLIEAGFITGAILNVDGGEWLTSFGGET